MKKRKYNSIMDNEKIRKDIFDYSPHVRLERITKIIRDVLYPIVDDTFKNHITYNTLPYGLSMDQDSCLIKFFKYAEGKRIYDYVYERTKFPLPDSYPVEDQYLFTKNEIITALVVHIKKYNVDFMTIRFRSRGNENFKSYWDKISDHEEET